MPRLLYIGQTPAEGTGSPVIVLRHLRRLADHGWEITVIAESGQDASACRWAGWTVAHLPLRRRWWPPYRAHHRLLRTIRTSLLARECRQLAGPRLPDAVLGYLAAHADFFPEVAAHFARQTRCPLSLLIHDDACAFDDSTAERARLRARHAWILRQAQRCWFVSPELAAAYDLAEKERRVLLPIPEGDGTLTSQPSAPGAVPKVYYAGFVWPPQYPLFASIARTLRDAGARLVLLTRETPELTAFLAAEPADWVKPFATNREALAHLTSNADGLLVSYAATTAEMPWIATSFPSKFIEYSHLGRPCALVAPVDSAIGAWAARRAFPDFFPPDQLPALERWARGLKNPTSARAAALRMTDLARGEFAPEAIHQQLEGDLQPGLRSALRPISTAVK